MNKEIQISVITENRSLGEKLIEELQNITGSDNISWYYFESAFLETVNERQNDVVYIDKSGKDDNWKIILKAILRYWPNALVIFIVSDDSSEDSVSILENGAFDIISSFSANKIKSQLVMISRAVNERFALTELARDKVFNDYIAENSRSMLSIINRDYRYEKVNAKFCSAHNIEAQEIVGKTLSEVWGDDTFIEKIKGNIDMCFNGDTVRYEANFITPLFGNRYYEVVFRPINRDNTEIEYLLAETYDVTELRLSQQVVREMEEEFKKLETNLPIGFVRCELDGTIIHANRAFMNIMEVEHETNMAGLTISEFYSEKGLFSIHLNQLESHKIKTFGRVQLYTFNGTGIMCRISGFIVDSEDSSQSFIDFAFEDCSRELMLESRLMQAQKLETIGALAGGLAHDFNNILGTIIGYSEMMLEENMENTGIRDKIIKIISAVTKAKNITGQILTFSRQVEQERIAVNVKEVLEETVGFIESGKPDNVIIKCDIRETGSFVLADPIQLFRVFLNLMTNGIQAMDSKGGALNLSSILVDGTAIRHDLTRDIVADEYIMVMIEDTGIGMEPSVVDRIFEPYFTTKEVGKGTGLGLSVVHGIISEIEGEILVSSKKGQGTVFTVYLPVAKDYPAIEISTGKRGKILLISGSPHESRVLSLALERQGYTLTFASDSAGLTGILSDHAKHPDTIIYMDDSEDINSDLIYDLINQLEIKIPLILITDSDQYLSKEKLLNSGVAKQVLHKPVSLREINNAIQVSLV